MTTPIESNSSAGSRTQVSGLTGVGMEPAWYAWLLLPADFIAAVIFLMETSSPDLQRGQSGQYKND